MPTITSRIAASADDCYYNPSAAFFINTAAYDVFFGKSDAGATVNTGLRFTGLGIPSGSVIHSAKLTFVARAAGAGTSYAYISAHKAQSPTVIADGADFDARYAARTTAQVDYQVSSAWTINSTYDSPDITAVIQELVNTYGAIDTALLMVENFAGRGSAGGWRSGYSYNGDPAKAVLLTVTYVGPGTNRLYLQNANAPYTPATWHGAWDFTTGAVTKGLGDKSGASTTVSTSETTAVQSEVALGRFVSMPLPAGILVGLSGMVGRSQGSGAQAYPFDHIWVTQGNSDSERGILVKNKNGYPDGLPTTTANGKPVGPSPQLPIAAGDRLVLELGWWAGNTDTTSRSATLYYGGTSSTDLSLNASGVLYPAWVEFTILTAWERTQRRPKYIYDDRFTARWDAETSPGFASYKVYVGTPGFTPAAGNLVATITDPTVTHYTVTGRSASTEYECYVSATIDGIERFARGRHITTTEANAAAVIQDGDFYIGQVVFSKITTDVGTEVCLGRKPRTAHATGTATYAMDVRSDGNHRHFNYQALELDDYEWPGHSGYYAEMIKPSGQTNPWGHMGFATIGGENQWLHTSALDPRGRTWADGEYDASVNTTYTNVAAGQGLVELSDGSVLVPFYEGAVDGSTDVRCMRTTDWDTFTEWGEVYVSQTIAGVEGTEPYMVKLGGTFPNETIACLFRPNQFGVATSPYLALSTDSGQTWGASTQTNIGVGIGSRYFGYSPPHGYLDPSTGRWWVAVGYRINTEDAARGTYLFYNDTPSDPSTWALAARVSTSTKDGAAPSYLDFAEYGHGTVMDFGTELVVAYTECVGLPESRGGMSNPYIGTKWFNKTGTITAQTVTKYTPETEPYAIPPAPVLSATAPAHLSWADVASEIGYEVHRCLTGTGAWSTVASLPTGTVSHDDDTALDGVTYDYRLAALGLFDTTYSNVETLTVFRGYPAHAEMTSTRQVGDTASASLSSTRSVSAGASATATTSRLVGVSADALLALTRLVGSGAQGQSGTQRTVGAASSDTLTTYRTVGASAHAENPTLRQVSAVAHATMTATRWMLGYVAHATMTAVRALGRPAATQATTTRTVGAPASATLTGERDVSALAQAVMTARRILRQEYRRIQAGKPTSSRITAGEPTATRIRAEEPQWPT